MIAFARTDTSVLGRWWWTVDRWTLAVLGVLILLGLLLLAAASPPVAERLGYDSFHFVRRQLAFLPIAVTILVGVSLLSPRQVLRLSVAVFAVAFALTVLTLVVGEEIKGSQRWIGLGPFALQPSEFLKPAFTVLAAWLFALHGEDEGFPGRAIAVVLFVAVVGVLLRQPDIGMAMLVAATWGSLLFVAGLHLVWVAGFVGLGIAGLVGAYFYLPHVASRIDRFLDPASGDNYQIARAMEAFANGGLFGRGPGEGMVKTRLPDAHSDFIFAVVGEEFGILACILLVGLFAFIVLRGFSRLYQEQNFFVLLATTGLLVQFGLQALINMASALHLMPTKGMTLPFISYGGSSLLALAYAMGMVLALTRRRVRQGGLA